MTSPDSPAAQSSSATAATTVSSSHIWFALRDGAGNRVAIPDSTVLKLLAILAAPHDAQQAQRLLDLAREDAGWAAWLLARSHSPSLLSCAGPEPPLDWAQIEDRIRQMVADVRFAQWLRAACTTVDWSAADAERWWIHRWRVLHQAKQMVQAHWETPSIRRAVFWWSILLADQIKPVGLAVVAHHPVSDRWSRLLERFSQLSRDRSTGVSPPALPLPQASVATLAAAVLSRLERSVQLERQYEASVEQAKLSAMKELAYGASHEINNPLANISSRAQMLLRGETDAGRRKSLETINRQAFRAHEMIADMMLFAKPPAPEFRSLDWATFCAETLAELDDERPDGIELQVTTSTRSAAVRGDMVQLRTAIQAIWRNALEALGQRGTIGWRAVVVDATPGEPPGQWCELHISDSGPGISATARQHLFDPFYSGREAGRGLGFGMSKAWRIMQLHDGQLVVAGAVNDAASAGMTTFVLRLPAQTEKPTCDAKVED